MNILTRREAIKQLMLGAASLSLAGREAGAQPLPAGSARLQPKMPAKAKAVIQVWLWGGASQHDTFDPKPEAGPDYSGPFRTPIETNVAGIRICELLPLLAKQADKYSLIRSLTHGNNGHETAAYWVQTGRPPGERLVFPGAGAVVSMFKGYDHGYVGLVPPYVVLTQLQGRFSEVGFLGPRYKPFATGGDPNAKRFVVEGVIAENLSEERQHSRRDLLHELDTLGRALPDEPRFAQHEKAEAKAYDMILGDAGKLFDLAQEKDELREQYGRSTFGQSCLMARRLVEAGVPYVTINYNGWDTHKQHFETMRRKLPEFDKGLATLLQDLASRGLLDSTIVWCCGEFGRTPKILWESPWNGGRSHYGNVFSALLAGGGFQGGRVLGASDAKGAEPAQRPVYPQDVLGSIYAQLGIDPDAPLPNPRGEDIKLTLPSKGTGRLQELL